MASTGFGAWYVETARDDLTRAPKVYFTLQAASFTIHADTFKAGREALLLIECTGGKLSLAFGFDRLVAGRTVAAKYRIGEAAPVASQWAAAQNSKGFGPYGRPEARAMVAAMREADELFVSTDTQILSSTSATYKLAGLKPAIDAHAKECGTFSAKATGQKSQN